MFTGLYNLSRVFPTNNKRLKLWALGPHHAPGPLALLAPGISNAGHNIPPQRPSDHRIHLIPETSPVVVWLYWYPHLLKDEIEWHCSYMHRLGIIRLAHQRFLPQSCLFAKRMGLDGSVLTTELSTQRRCAMCFLSPSWTSC